MSNSSDNGEGILANHPFVDTDDAAAARARISSLLIPHELDVHRGLLPFRAVHRHVALDAISLHYLRYEPEVTVTWSPPKWFHLLAIPIFGLCRVGVERRLIEVAPGQCFVFNPSVGPRLDLIGNCAALFVKIPSAELSTRSTDSFGAPAESVVEFQSRRAVRGEACGALIELIRWVCRDLDHASPVSMSPIAGRRIEDLVIETVLSACPYDRSVPMTTPEPKAVPQNVRRCEEFVELHAADPITIADMTAVSGASERMLFQAFRDHRRTSPMAYLKSRRLERAHAELASAEARGRTVSEIAGAWGFAHPGHFAKEYRGKFGRNPSDTLRGEPDPGYLGPPDTSGGV
jgi:AraC-like DNA-binding protein